MMTGAADPWSQGPDGGEATPPPVLEMRPSDPGPGRPSRLWARLAAMVVVGLIAGTAGGLTADRLEQGRQPSVPATPTPAGSASQLSGPTLNIDAVIAKAEPAIVTIHGQVAQGFAIGTVAGSGIVLTADGEVLTNAHVVSGATNIQVTIGSGAPHSAQVLGADTTADVALLRVAGVSGLATAEMGSSSDVHVGDDVVAIGNALDLTGPPTVTRGIVSALNRSFDTGNGTMTGLIQTDAATSSGNSGGALLNAKGQVIGITTMTATSSRGTSAENVNFAIPAADAVAIANSLVAGR